MRVCVRNEGRRHVTIGTGYGHVSRTACRTMTQHQAVKNPWLFGRLVGLVGWLVCLDWLVGWFGRWVGRSLSRLVDNLCPSFLFSDPLQCLHCIADP